MQLDTYQTVTGQDFQRPARPPQSVLVTANADTNEVPRYIQNHVAQVDQWCWKVNEEDILNQQLLESLDGKYFKGQRQAYINYANRTLTGLIHNLYDAHGTIMPMDIEESE